MLYWLHFFPVSALGTLEMRAIAELPPPLLSTAILAPQPLSWGAAYLDLLTRYYAVRISGRVHQEPLGLLRLLIILLSGCQIG